MLFIKIKMTDNIVNRWAWLYISDHDSSTFDKKDNHYTMHQNLL